APSPCPRCATVNRTVARFCKGCGDRLRSAADPFADLAGIDAIAAQVRAQLEDAVLVRTQGHAVRSHRLILGSPGAGTTRLARAIADCAERVGLTGKGATLVTAREIRSQKPEDLLSAAAGGTLIVDQAHRLLPAPDVPSGGEQALFDFLDALANRGDGSDPLVLVTGAPGPFAPFLRPDAALPRHFGEIIRLNDWSADQLAEVAERRFVAQGWTVDEATRARLLARCRYLVNAVDLPRRHGHAVDELVQQATQAARARLGGAVSGVLSEGDITGPVDQPVTLEELFAQLDTLQGIDAVREQLKQMIRAAQERKARDPGRPVLDGHVLLMGNAGTGKTTIAKLLPRLLCKAGILPTERLVEYANPASLQSGYVGQTSGRVNDAIDRARGGVLFIDEAHQMADSGGHNYQREILNTMLPRLENERGQFLCVLGGYTSSLPAVLALDQGMPSRFPEHYRIQLANYDADTLASIYLAMARDASKTLTPEAEHRMRQLMRLLRRWALPAFANARGAREFLSACIARQVARVGADPSADPNLLVEEDIKLPRSATGKSPEEALVEAEQKLAALTGQPQLRSVINRLRGNLLLWRAELEEGADAAPPLEHILLQGSPGTGKTTVARIMGSLLYGLGMLPRPHVEEVRGTELIKGIQGAAAQAVRELVERAIGGVLFLDEVSGLIGQPQGVDVARELLPHLVDAKGRFVMIVAGYPHVVDGFLKLDDGLARRFGTVLELEDYGPEEVHAIAEKAAKEAGLTLTPEASAALLTLLRSPRAAELLPSRNASMAHTLIGAMRDRLASRLAPRLAQNLAAVSTEERRTILVDDVPTGFDARGNAC
ncbi:MAG TPA: AAA family ATPase, partial [Gemmatimonadales bacterium]|nr:AAA family ATPase [Gemmatimonadales bacterium]